MTRLAFPGVDRPAVSVVMVTYGGWTWARRALEAVIENTEPCYEVIVVDNASPDETPLRLREDVEGAKVLFNSNNAGFAAGVDRGVCYATAPNLVLLNSDAMVQPGWLPPLLDVIESDRSAAAVGEKRATAARLASAMLLRRSSSSSSRPSASQICAGERGGTNNALRPSSR